jgi:hypothetical protein
MVSICRKFSKTLCLSLDIQILRRIFEEKLYSAFENFSKTFYIFENIESFRTKIWTNTEADFIFLSNDFYKSAYQGF